MRTLIMTCVSIFLLFSIHCSKLESKKKIVFGYFTYNSDSLLYSDTMSIVTEKDGIYEAILSSFGNQKKINYKQNNDGVCFHPNDSIAVRYSSLTDSILLVNYDKFPEYHSPFFVADTKFGITKTYIIGEQKFEVSLFTLDNLTSNRKFVYYTPKFGFICYNYEYDRYKRIVDLVNFPNMEKETALMLIDEIIQDSAFFANPHYYSFIPPPFPFPKNHSEKVK